MKPLLENCQLKKSNHLLYLCFGFTVIPALIYVLLFLPYTGDHFGLTLSSIISGGFIYWTLTNLTSGIYTSKQGVYKKSETPIKYWINTTIIALFTALAIGSCLLYARLIN